MATARASSLHVALMRGINVGGKNKLAMRDLARVFEDAGASDVRTSIQSGNVVFAAPARVAGGIPSRVREHLEAEFAIRSPVIMRSAKELARVIDRVPLSWRTADEKALAVLFLEREPTRAAVANLDADRSPGDRFEVVGREVYLWLPNGAARSKLTNDYFERALGTVSTARNWRTITRLATMCGCVSSSSSQA